MKKIADFGGAEVFYIPTDKFKTCGINVTFCDNLSKDRAYRNALVPMILNRGCSRFPTAREIARRLLSLYGAGISVNVDKKGEIQLIQFVADFPDEKYAALGKSGFERSSEGLAMKVLRLLFDLITDPVTEMTNGQEGFAKEYFVQERINQDSFIRSAVNDKQSYAMLRCQALMCAGEPYGVYELGAVSDGESLDPVSLYRYYRDYFLRRLPVKIFYCGREEPEALLTLLDGISCLHEGDRINLNPGYVPFGGGGMRMAEEVFDVAQGKLNIGLRTNIPPDSPQFPALAVCNGIFGAGTQSKLFQNVREKNSLAYYAASRLERLKGIMVAYCGIACKNEKQARELILAQLEDIKRGAVTQEEYEATIRMFRNSFHSYKDTQFAIMDFYIGQSFLRQGQSIDAFIDSITRVTIEDVIAAAQNIHPDLVYFLRGTDEEAAEGDDGAEE